MEQQPAAAATAVASASAGAGAAPIPGADAAAADGDAATKSKTTAMADIAEQLRQNAMECRGVMHDWAQAMLYGVS